MVETPVLILRPRVHVGMATTALVLGIVGIFIPFVGIALGVTAVILGATALHLKTTSTGPAIAGIAVGALAIFWGIILVLLINFIFGSHFALPASTRDHAVTAQINERKDFTINETAKMGPIDVRITGVQRHYVPTADDVALASKDTPKEVLPTDSQYSSGTTLLENEVEYVRVEGTAQVNGGTFLGDDDLELANMMLNNVLPYIYTGGLDGYAHKSSIPTSAEPFTYVFRIRKGSDALKLQRYVSIWKKINPIVGTEGMPQADLVYTIALN